MSYPRIYIFEAFEDSFSLGGSRDITALSAPILRLALVALGILIPHHEYNEIPISDR